MRLGGIASCFWGNGIRTQKNIMKVSSDVIHVTVLVEKWLNW